MNQKEKSNLSREKILAAALLEFGEKSYRVASINTICNKGGISKGILYHHFADKEALFLLCVQMCFDAITDHLSTHLPVLGQGVEQDLVAYFEVRRQFFEENPCYQGLFYQAASPSLKHLADKIERVRQPLEHYNATVLATILQHVDLRPEITMQEVGHLYKIFQQHLLESGALDTAAQSGAKARDDFCIHWMRILLHGVIKSTL